MEALLLFYSHFAFFYEPFVHLFFCSFDEVKLVCSWRCSLLSNLFFFTKVKKEFKPNWNLYARNLKPNQNCFFYKKKSAAKQWMPSTALTYQMHATCLLGFVVFLPFGQCLMFTSCEP